MKRLFGLALALCVSHTALAQNPPDRYSLYLGAGTHPTHPKAYAVEALILSAGGSGMGSRSNMNFSSSDISIAYSMYGRKGEPTCVDVLPPQSVTVASDGQTIPWVNHGLPADHVVFVTGNQTVNWYIYGPTADSFKLSQYPYNPPGVTTPHVPYTFGSGVQLELNAYEMCVGGGSGGGIIGDQPLPGPPTRIYFGNAPYPRSIYWYGSQGQNILGGGGAGGGSFKGGGGSPQIGGMNGNAGTNLQGGGGSGAGWMDPETGFYPIWQWGPSGGAGGTAAELSLPLKPSYKFYGGLGQQGGNPGVGGFRGGDGGHGIMLFKEKIAP